MIIKSTSIFKGRIWWHLLFWTVYLLYLSVPKAIYENEFARQFMINAVQLPVRMIATYVLIYWLLPKYIYVNRFMQFFAWFIPIAAVLSVSHRLLWYEFIYPIFYPEHGVISFSWMKLTYDFFNVYFIAVVAAAIKILKQMYMSQKDREKLRKESLEAELKFLKAQIHPHFLFNTLNNLYALTLKKSPLASEIVLKLSDLLDYMLYECNASTISLEKEIKLLENYISLEKIRYGDELDIEFYIIGETAGLSISPMILLPFIENAFKHGVSGEITNQWIKISLTVSNSILVFEIENSKDSKEKMEESYTQGIGLKNVKRRLELIYKDKSSIEVEDLKTKFVARLRINLN